MINNKKRDDEAGKLYCRGNSVVSQISVCTVLHFMESIMEAASMFQVRRDPLTAHNSVELSKWN